MNGLIGMILGFFDGTGLVDEEAGMKICEDTIRLKIIHNGWMLGNSSASGDHFKALFAFWDITYNIHPLFLNCRGWIYNFADNI